MVSQGKKKKKKKKKRETHMTTLPLGLNEKS